MISNHLSVNNFLVFGKHYKAAPALRKAPEALQNQHCRARYKTVAVIKKWEADLFTNLAISEQMVVTQAIASIYV